MANERNKPLTINVRIFDVESDKEERKTTYSLRKVHVDARQYRSLKAAIEEQQKQQSALDRKVKSIINLIIWAAHNGKSLEFVSADLDGDE
jgi:hypothetical protein